MFISIEKLMYFGILIKIKEEKFIIILKDILKYFMKLIVFMIKFINFGIEGS